VDRLLLVRKGSKKSQKKAFFILNGDNGPIPLVNRVYLMNSVKQKA